MPTYRFSTRSTRPIPGSPPNRLSASSSAAAPRGDDGQLGGESGVGELEADLIIALARGAVAHAVGPFFSSDLHLSLGNEGPRDGGAEEVGALVHGVGAQHGKHEISDELFPEVPDVHGGGPGAEGLVAHGDQLFALAEIRAEGDHVALVGLDEPAQDDGGVESARIGEHHLLDGLAHAVPERGKTMPFWMCSRFSAWSRTMLRRPSRAASVISSQRSAGRRRMTTACGEGARSSVSLT